MSSDDRRERAKSMLADFLTEEPRAGTEGAIETLVTAHPELASELRGLNAQPEQNGDTAPFDPSDTPMGRLIGDLRRRSIRNERYSQHEEIARGGMGVVLRVRDGELDREVAMKTSRGASDASRSESHLARFLEEAQVSGQLVHPGIVPVHEVGVDEDGQPFFTMQLVRGQDLRDVYALEQRGEDGWTRTRVLGVLLKVCEALSYAHSKGVIHRDLKPGNVMVGRFGEVYVMDWGLARVLGKEDQHGDRLALQQSVELQSVRQRELRETPNSPVLTLDGQIVGTPSYMPPEQALGDPDRLDRRADVYALGAMLYELLARRMPYEPKSGQTSPTGIVLALLDGPPEPLTTLAPDAPPELVAITERAMAREPDERYGDMGEVARDLRAFLEGHVVSAYEAGAWAEARKWFQRNRVMALTLTGSVTLAIVALAIAAVVQSSARAEAEADRAAAVASAEAARSAEIAALAAREEAEAASLAERELREDLERVVAELGEPFPVATRLRARRPAQDGGFLELTLPGAPLVSGDNVTMEVLSVSDVSLFVFNQDDSGLVTQLFPIQGFEPANPLPAGEAHVLPGRRAGTRTDIPWVVDDAGGPERLVALAVAAGTSFDPNDWLGDLIPDSEVATRGMAPELDGVRLVPPTGPHPRSAFERLRRLSESRDDVWVRLLQLRR